MTYFHRKWILIFFFFKTQILLNDCDFPSYKNITNQFTFEKRNGVY